MKVTGFKTRVLRTPADNSLAVRPSQTAATRTFVTLEMGTDEGIEGIGLTFVPALNTSPLTPALKEAVDALAGMVTGEDPMPVEAVARRFDRGGLRLGAGRDLLPRPGGRGHGPLGHQRQSVGPVGVLFVGGLPGPGTRLRQRRPDAHGERRVLVRSGPAAGGDGLQANEGPVGGWADGGQGTGAGPGCCAAASGRTST